MPVCAKTEEGYRIGSGASIPEVVTLVDLKRGIALWSGAREEVEPRYDSLRNRCKGLGIQDQFESDIRLLRLPGDVSLDEMNWMMKKHLLPRRVAMRMKHAEN